MAKSLHKIAIESGAELAPACEIGGSMQPATYAVTVEQLGAIVGKTAGRLLTALDGMDRGCAEKGFKGHENGYGEPAGDELDAARDELALLVGHISATATQI